LKISIIVTSYNQKEYLIEALESALNQSLPPYEIIIVDDCSSDGSQEVIAGYTSRFPERIRGIYNEHNMGVTQARINALKAVTGDYVACLDGDDRFLPAKLEREANALMEIPQAQIAYSNYRYMSADGILAGAWANGSIPPSGEIFCQTFARDFPRRELFRSELINFRAWKQIGFYDPAIRIYQSYDMQIRLTKVLQAVYVDEILSEYRIGHDSVSKAEAATHLAYLDRIVKKNMHLLDDVTPERQEYVLKGANDYLSQVAQRAMRQTMEGHERIRNRLSALRYYFMSTRYANKPIDFSFALSLLSPKAKYKELEFVGWDEATGLGPQEGPYPEWQLPVVRWGFGPCTVLVFESKERPLVFSAICGPHHLPRQTMKIILNGKRIHQKRFDNPGEYHEIRVPFRPHPGRNELVLEYDDWETIHTNRPLALLFKRLQVAPAE
jgi:glycosyltransferase involved in cell wall biosynthesis